MDKCPKIQRNTQKYNERLQTPIIGFQGCGLHGVLDNLLGSKDFCPFVEKFAGATEAAFPVAKIAEQSSEGLNS